jgi:hypothetical protein
MEIEKTECARCGYNKSKGSLHRHHVDRNHDNDEPGNVVILCSNCHMELHHNKWKLSEIGIFGYDIPLKRNAFKEVTYLSKQLDLSRKENKELKTRLALIESSSGYNSETALKRKLALYSFLTLFGYKIRDAITFFDNIPDDMFDKVIDENDKCTRDLVNSIYDAFRDKDISKIQKYLAERQEFKISKNVNSEYMELMHRLPLK